MSEQPGKVVALQKVGNGGEYVPTEAGLELVEHLASEGHPNVAIAKHLGIDDKTFRMLRKRDERVEEAVLRGRAANERELTNILMEKARGGDTIAAIFLLKGRHGWRDKGDVPEGAQQLNVQIVNLPAPRSPEDYNRAIQGEATEDDGDR